MDNEKALVRVTVSASNLAGLTPFRSSFDRRLQFLWEVEPDLRAGYTIMLYDIRARVFRDKYRANWMRGSE